MPSFFSHPGRIVAGLLIGVVVSAGAALQRRRNRRIHQSPPPPPQSSPRPAATAEEEQPVAQSPLLKPMMFAFSHFGLLVVLLAMMIGGLAFRGIERYPPDTTFHVNGGDPKRGRQALMRHGCGGCHEIAGIRGATGTVGPSLRGFRQRMYIGGQLPNTPENLIPWLQDPQRFAPGTAMPDLGVTEAEARDMAAYFFSR